MNNCKCNECNTYRKMQKAGIRQTILELENCSQLEDSKWKWTARGTLFALKSNLSTYKYPLASCLLKRTKDLIDQMTNNITCNTEANKNAISILIAELKAFVGEDESAVADKSAE